MTLLPLSLVLATSVSVGACVGLDDDGYVGDTSYELSLGANDEVRYSDGVDVVSTATPPPDLFVEILSPLDGDTVPAGTAISAFGGPGWAVPQLNLHVDGVQVDSVDGYNVSFPTDEGLTSGSHTFRVEFTCVLDICNGSSASAEVSLNVSGASDPGGSDGGTGGGGGGGDPGDDVPGGGEPGGDDPGDDGTDAPGGTEFGGAACNAAGGLGNGVSGLFVFFSLMFVARRRRRATTI